MIRIKRYINSLKSTDEEEFKNENLKINIKRGLIVSIVTMVIQVFVLVLYIAYNLKNNESLSNNPYIRMYGLFIILNSFFLIIFTDFLNKSKASYNYIYVAYAFIFFIMGWNMGIAFLDGEITSYILAVVAVGMIAILSPLKATLILIFFQLLFLIGVSRYYESNLRFAAYVNSTIGVIISVVAGAMSYTYRVESYLSHKELRKKSSEHESLNLKLNEANKKLEYLAQTDGLTGIFNRRMFDSLSKIFWQECLNEVCPLGVIMIDIDHFKCYNDTYGHQCGDDCLKTIVRKLRDLVPEGSMLARYGGEEFAILVKCNDSTRTKQLADKLKNEIENMGIEHKKSPVKPVVTLSFGVYSGLPHKGDTLESIIKKADKALYQAKEGGRNIVVVYKD